MALDFYNSNPSLIWQGQGTTIDNNSGGMSLPEDAPDGNFWDWWTDNGESAASAANAILCAINPRRYGCYSSPESGSNTEDGKSQNNTLVFAILGFIVVLLLLLFFKK